MIKKNSIYSLIVAAIFSLTSASISLAEDQESASDKPAEVTKETSQEEAKKDEAVVDQETSSESTEKESNEKESNEKESTEATTEATNESSNSEEEAVKKTDDENQEKEDKKVEDLEITDVWARASIASSKNSAAYLKINNATDKEIVITAASAPGIANNVELHNSFVDEKGVSRMSTIDKVVVPANSNIEFKPGGMHIMLFDLKSSLSAGEKFTLNLTVENGEPIVLQGEIRD